MTGLSGLSLKYLSHKSLNSGPISFSSSSLGRILKPASMAFEERRAFSGETSHSWNNYGRMLIGFMEKDGDQR